MTKSLHKDKESGCLLPLKRLSAVYIEKIELPIGMFWYFQALTGG